MPPRSVPAIVPGFRVLGPGIALLLLGCQADEREAEEQDRYFKEEPARVEVVHANRLANEPTAFLRSRSGDPVHWQPWTAELLEHSRLEQRPIFALVVGGSFPRTHDVLAALCADPVSVRALNTHYVCTLVDVHAHPEVALLAYELAREIRRPIAFPVLMWLSHEGNPVAWLPLNRNDAGNISEVLANSHEMVRKLWADDPRYVVTNSRRDNRKRAERIKEQALSNPESEVDLADTILEAGRNLTALYDPTSRQIDETGGLLPTGILQFAAALAVDPETPASLRERLVEMIHGHAGLLLRSAVRDPLDGGFFHARQAAGWTLPSFFKDGGTQSEALLALSWLAGLPDGERYLEIAGETLQFARDRLGADEEGIALFELPAPESAAGKLFLWPRDTLETLLTAEEFAVAEKCFGFDRLGNIPAEADPRRIHFQRNSLGHAMSPAEAANDLGLAANRAEELLDSARKRLLVQRREQADHPDLVAETTRTTAGNARFAAALAEYGAAAGEPAHLAQAQAIMRHLRESRHSEAGGLMRIPAAGGARGVPARAIDYASLLDALFTLYRQDLDPDHLAWAGKLADEALDRLLDDDSLLHETPAQDRVVDTPLFSDAMVFGGSSWGGIFGPLVRLHLLTGSEQLAAVLARLTASLAGRFAQSPVLHTDFGVGALAARSRTLVCLDGPAGEETLAGMRQLLREPAYRGVTAVHLSPSLPPGFRLPASGETPRAIVIRDGKQVGEAASADDLRGFLRPGDHPEPAPE